MTHNMNSGDNISILATVFLFLFRKTEKTYPSRVFLRNSGIILEFFKHVQNLRR